MSDVREFLAREEKREVSKQEQLRQAKEAMVGEMPTIPSAPECSVALPRGLWWHGAYKRYAIVRELTGHDEEMLAKAKNNSEFFDNVIALGVESIDDVNFSQESLVNRIGSLRTLLIGERDQLFLAVVRATFGDKKTLGFRCTACGEQQEVDLILSEDLKVKEVENVDAPFYVFTTSRGHELQYRLVTGEDQAEAFSKRGSTTADQNTIILSRVIGKMNGGLIPDPIGYVRSMSMRDRKGLLEELVAKQPTIDLTLKTVCAACRTDQTLGLDWGDLFRP